MDYRSALYGGLSVTYTLPLGTEDDIKAEVEYVMDYTDGGKGLFLFTSNVTGIDVSTKNLMTAYQHLDSLGPGWKSSPKRRSWPHNDMATARIEATPVPG